jgi:hypothetical protein
MSDFEGDEEYNSWPQRVRRHASELVPIRPASRVELLTVTVLLVACVLGVLKGFAHSGDVLAGWRHETHRLLSVAVVDEALPVDLRHLPIFATQSEAPGVERRDLSRRTAKADVLPCVLTRRR